MVFKSSKKFLIFILYLLGLIGTLALTPDERTACTQGLICGVKGNQLNFFVVGDTGGAEFNIGKGLISYVRPTPVQTKLADAMARLAAKKGLDFVVNVGDNVSFCQKNKIILILGIFQWRRQ